MTKIEEKREPLVDSRPKDGVASAGQLDLQQVPTRVGNIAREHLDGEQAEKRQQHSYPEEIQRLGSPGEVRDALVAMAKGRAAEAAEFAKELARKSNDTEMVLGALRSLEKREAAALVRERLEGYSPSVDVGLEAHRVLLMFFHDLDRSSGKSETMRLLQSLIQRDHRTLHQGCATLKSYFTQVLGSAELN